MTSTPPNIERALSPLSDSWATISSMSGTRSDDGTDASSCGFDNASIIDGPSTDDVISLSTRDSDNDTIELDLEMESINSEHDNEGGETTFRAGRDAEDDEAMDHTILSTNSNSTVTGGPASDNWRDEDFVILRRPLPVSGINNDSLSVSIQHSYAKEPLEVNEPFRVMYMGDTSLRSRVMDKIGDMLVASHRDGWDTPKNGASSLKYHVVPTSFGLNANAELLPIHMQLVVDQCVAAFGKCTTINMPPVIRLELKNGDVYESTWEQNDYSLFYTASKDTNSETRDDRLGPLDLAIFVLGDNDPQCYHKSMVWAHKFMKRHKVPAIVISQSPVWDKLTNDFPLDPNSIHISTEYFDADTGKMTLAGRSPIHMQLFENTAAEHLNHHVASLTAVPLGDTDKDTNAARYTDRSFAEAPSWDEHFRTFRRRLRKMAVDLDHLSVSSAIAVLATFWALLAFLGITNGIGFGFGFGSKPALPAEVVAPLPPAFPNVSVFRCDAQAAVNIQSYVQELTESVMNKFNDREQSLVHALDDCHAIIWLPKARTASKFAVKVTREANVLNFTSSNFLKDAIKVQLPPDEAYGRLNISLHLKAKPGVEQITELDFGNPWLKTAIWKQLGQSLSVDCTRGIVFAANGLRGAYEQVNSDLQRLRESERVKETYRRINKTSQDSIIRFREFGTQLAKELAKDWQELKCEYCQDAWEHATWIPKTPFDAKMQLQDGLYRLHGEVKNGLRMSARSEFLAKIRSFRCDTVDRSMSSMRSQFNEVLQRPILAPARENARRLASRLASRAIRLRRAA